MYGSFGLCHIPRTAGVAPKITQAFKRCYSKAGARFYDVDFELKSLCDELRKVGTELDQLLKTT